jgi:acetoin utilization protein AcuB
MFVEEIMTRDVIAATERDTVGHVEQLMVRGRFRHVPIVRPTPTHAALTWPPRVEGTVIGVVSDRDIALALAEASTGGRQRPMGEVMHAPALTVLPEMPIEDAALLMADHQIGCLPVVAGDESLHLEGHVPGKLIGIITASDLFHALIRLLGVQEPSTRVRLLLPAGRVDLLADTLQIIAAHGVTLAGLVAEPVDRADRWPVVLRLRTIYPAPVLRRIRALGITIETPAMPPFLAGEQEPATIKPDVPVPTADDRP